ncbi:protein of unknown function [Cupriavidus taiwanensis]|nr:protein of unknown function [Cupriavidus taiwanensis]SOZ00551.1 hypothetical protein CBM2595_A110093 [Cupriavidus taiwanensis]SOZ03652.1 hypothetical protein CBM2597_A150094 [Cupriavidus taiwanensis]SPD42263.1 protein of unknown function [Cupriavidus taiwanensis]
MPHTARIARLQGEWAVFFLACRRVRPPARRGATTSTEAGIAILDSTSPALFAKLRSPHAPRRRSRKPAR